MCCPRAPLILVVSALFWGCSNPAPTGGDPATSDPPNESDTLSFEPPLLDLGDVPAGTTQRFAVKLRNTTDSVVSIDTLGSSCGCANLKIEENGLSPGEATDVSGLISVGDTPGPVRRHVFVKLKDDNGHEVALELRTTCISLIQLSPETLTLEPDVTNRTAVQASIVATNGTASPIRLTSAKASSPGIHVELPSLDILPGTSAQVNVTCPHNVIQEQNAIIEVATSHHVERKLTLQLHIRPKSSLVVKPSSLRLGVISKSDLLKKAPLPLSMIGSVLDAYKFETVATPPYLRMTTLTWRAPDLRLFHFDVVDSFSRIDLSHMLIFQFSERNGGEKLTITVPISGFLLASD